MTKEQIDQMVNAFLCWKLPQTFNPDCYISFAPKSDFRGNPPTWPIGTNLFSYTEAKAMVEHMLAALTAAPPVPTGYRLMPVELNFDLEDAFFDAWETEKDRLLAEKGSYGDVLLLKAAWKALLNSSAMLSASPPAPLPEGWRDIASAPRDGTTILVYFKRHGWMSVSWEDPNETGNGIWCVEDHKHGPYPVRGYNDGDDTHWTPLPAPPSPPEDTTAADRLDAARGLLNSIDGPEAPR